MPFASGGVWSIEEAGDLRALALDARSGRRRTARRVVLGLSAIPPEELELRGKRINRAYYSCGCAEGTAFGFLALITYIGWLALGEGGFAAVGWPYWLGLLAVFIAGTGAGRWLGLARARTALRREVDELVARSTLRIEPTDDPEKPRAPCGHS